MKTILLSILLLFPIFSFNTVGERNLPNSNTLPFIIPEVTITSSTFPKLLSSDSIINNSPVNLNSVAWRQKNPGNLRDFYTGKYRTFSTLEQGYESLLKQLELYVSGKSIWTDSTTTLEEYVHIYASEARTKKWYMQVMTKGLNCSNGAKIASMSIDSLAKYHIKIEDYKLYKIMYE